MSSLRSQTLWSTLPILVTSVVSVVTVPIYFAVLGEQMYALWFYVGTLTGTFGFMDLGLGVTVGRFMGVALGRQDEQAVREYWVTGNLVVLPLLVLFSAAFLFLGLAFGPSWFKIADADLGIFQWAVLWGGVTLFLNYYTQMWSILCATHLDFRFLSTIRAIFSLVNTLGVVCVALITKNLPVIIAFGALLSGLQLFLFSHRGIKRYEMPLAARYFQWSRLKEMLPYCLKTFAQLISGSFAGSVDRLLLGRLAPSQSFAAYSVSLNIGSRIQGLSQSVMGPIFCNSSRGVGGDNERSPRAIYRETFDFMVPWYVLAMVWVAVWSGPILHFWLGSDLGASVDESFPFVVIACCIGAISNLSGAQLGPIDRLEMGLLFSLAAAALAVGLMYAGWKLDGLRGASIGFLISRVALILQDLYVRKQIGVEGGKPEIKLLGYGLGCGLVMWAAREAAVRGGFPPIFLVATAGVLGVAFSAPMLRQFLVKEPVTC